MLAGWHLNRYDNSQNRPSLFLDLLAHLVLVYDFLEVPEAFGSVVKHILLLDALAHDLVEDDLEAYGDAAALEVGVEVFPDLLDLGVFLTDAGASLLHIRLLHYLAEVTQIKIINTHQIHSTTLLPQSSSHQFSSPPLIIQPSCYPILSALHIIHIFSISFNFNSQFIMNKIISKSRYLFSLFARDTNEALIRASIHSPISTESKTVAPQLPQYTATKLSNGVTVLTESVSVPSNVHIGILVDVGSRDETAETSGALLSLKNTYLKTAINTSETVNYGITQMAGGEFEMEYNRENSYYHAYCLAHDVVDVFSMVADSAFQPKNFVSTSVGMYKNANTHKLETFLGGNQVFQDNIHQAAYGKNTLGNPIQGLRSNVNYLTASIIQKFQASTLNPKRIVISAAGVQNHDEFVDLVNEKFNTTILSNSNFERTPAKYLGGQVRNLTEANNVHVVVAFEGATHKNVVPLLIAEEILGNGRKSGRLQKNILNKHVFIDSAQALNTSYTETGLFGIKVSGSSSHAKDILNVAAKELSGLRNISEADLQLAKQSLKGKINRANLSTAKRLEERTKSLYYIGQTNEHLTSQIDTITLAQVQQAVSNSLKTPLTLVSKGGEVTSLPSYDNVSKLFI